MKILLVEDDHLAANLVAAKLREMFAHAEVKPVSTEQEFRARFEEFAKDPPDLVIMDVMLTWAFPSPNMEEPPDEVREGGFHQAGFRCVRMLVEDERTKKIQTIIHSVIERGDVDYEFKSLPQNVRYLRKGGRVVLFDYVNSVLRASAQAPPVKPKIFVAHGHDGEAKEAMARYIEKLGMTAVILNEQAGRGRTIIEKFEENSDVAFAVVLLTPDDIGAAKGNKESLTPRARQNVIFELGFFLAKLGRDNVCALFKGGVEMPSDYGSVSYIGMDEGGAWRLSLAREMKEAGLPVDMSNIL